MSVSRHSAELGFTLIKEGLPKSAGSSLAPLQPRAERASERGSLPPRHPFAPSFLPLVSMPLTFVPFKKEKKKKKKNTLICLSSCLSLFHFSPLSLQVQEERERGGGGKKKCTKTQINYLDFFFPQRAKEKKKKCLTLQFERKGERREGGGRRRRRNKNCIRYKILQSARDMKN